MTNSRRIILDWADQGHIAPDDLPRALSLAEVLPSHDDWRRFLDLLLLWMGAVLVAAGVIFFLAYNWNDLSRYAKFALVETLIIAALLIVVRIGLERADGRAALLGASLVLGALLALVGQTYQTGADTFELFATWAAMILPWVLLGRLAVLWLLWLALVNVAVGLYFDTFPNAFGLLFGPERMLWVLFWINTAALAAWELAGARGVQWPATRWEPRLVATVAGAFVTVLAIMQIFDAHGTGMWAVPAWFAWLATAWAVYRHRIKDVFVLAGGVLSVIVVVASFLAKHMVDHDASGFLFVGVLVIALSAAGGWWLKRVAAEVQS